MLASERGYYNIVERLIKAGANLNLENNIGYNAYNLAAAQNHSRVMMLLVSAGITI